MTKTKESNLFIELDDEKGKKIPRFSCCIHRAYNDINKEINSLPKLRADLNSLNKWTKSHRAKNPKDELFNNQQLRLKCHNKTRWSSYFLNLHSVYKAYIRNPSVVSDCPLKFKDIEV